MIDLKRLRAIRDLRQHDVTVPQSEVDWLLRVIHQLARHSYYDLAIADASKLEPIPLRCRVCGGDGRIFVDRANFAEGTYVGHERCSHCQCTGREP